MANNSDTLRVSRQLANPSVSERQLAEHFEIDTNKSEPFRPRFRLKSEARAILHPDDLMIVGSLSVRDLFAQARQREYREKIANGWDGLRLVSEGDSWFQYPILLREIIDDLFQEYAIFDMSAAGDSLHNMRRGVQQIIDALKAESSHGLLLSGGGNDFLDRGVFSHVLRGFNRSFNTADQYVIMHRLAEVMRSIEADYAAMFEAVTQQVEGVRIFCHGYDWAIPRFGGLYLWPVMNDKEIPEPLRPDIVKIIVNAFNEALSGVASSTRFGGRITYIDCRGAIGRSDEWFDEIHPKNPGFSRVADRFRRAINGALVA